MIGTQSVLMVHWDGDNQLHHLDGGVDSDTVKTKMTPVRVPILVSCSDERNRPRLFVSRDGTKTWMIEFRDRKEDRDKIMTKNFILKTVPSYYNFSQDK